ncbi:hypothetical protein [Paenibacillus alginolyticus]|nr:hypothetical protein [Paenibacillus frigoriresistens]
MVVPATYVIDNEGIIVTELTEQDYRTGMEPSGVLNIIRSL